MDVPSEVQAMSPDSSSPTKKFAAVRVILGVYLLIHFLYLLPFSSELFSSSGMYPNAFSGLSFGYFPNLLFYFDSPLSVSLWIGLLALASLLFIVGTGRRIVSVLLWYGWACLYHRNNLIHN